MSSAQIIIHRRDNNDEYEMTSENISDRCKAILRLLETKSVANSVNQVLRNLDNMGNSFDNSLKYDSEQKEFIKKQILDIAKKKSVETNLRFRFNYLHYVFSLFFRRLEVQSLISK